MKVKCPLCIVRIRHIKRTNEKKSEYFCGCGTRFTSTNALKRHESNSCKLNSKPSIENCASTEDLASTVSYSIELDKLSEADLSLKSEDGKVVKIGIPIDKIQRILAIIIIEGSFFNPNSVEFFIISIKIYIDEPTLNDSSRSTDDDLPLTPALSPMEINTFSCKPYYYSYVYYDRTIILTIS